MASVDVQKVKLSKAKRAETSSAELRRDFKAKPVISSSDAILRSYRPFFDNNNRLISTAQDGLPISAVTDFAELSAKSQKEIAGLIHTTPKTLQNYANGSKKLPVLQSELLLKLFALYQKGLEVFASVESFNRWLAAPAFGLYNDVPASLITTSTGINEVLDELIRIEYGDLA